MKKHVFLPLTLLAAGLISTQTFAAGFQLSEYTVTGLGRSFAGLGVAGDDFSALAFNPAGMQYNKTSGAQTGATVVSLHFDYKGAIGTAASIGGNGIPTSGGARSGYGHTRPTRVLPHLFAQQKLNERVTLGLGAYVPYGLATDYSNNWFAQSHAGLSQMEAVDVSPALSYEVNKWLSVGAALNIQYIKAHLTGKVESNGLYFDSSKTNMVGDDYGLGYTLGVTATPRKDIRLGLAYRSKISHELEGDLKVTGMPDVTMVPGVGAVPTGGQNGKSPIKAKVTTPEVITLSGAYDLNKCFTLSGIVKYTRWSRFKSLDVLYKRNNQMASSTNENWKNTWYVGAGVDYHVNKDWTLRTGIGYDQTAIRDAAYRTPRIPDGRRVLTSLGLSWQKNNWQVDAGYMHIFAYGGESAGHPRNYSANHIKFSADADLFAFGVQYKF